MGNTLDQQYPAVSLNPAGENLTIAISFDDKANCYTRDLGSNIKPLDEGNINIPSTPKVPPQDLHFFRVR